MVKAEPGQRVFDEPPFLLRSEHGHLRSAFGKTRRDGLFGRLLQCSPPDSTVCWLFQVQEGCEMPPLAVLQAGIRSR